MSRDLGMLLRQVGHELTVLRRTPIVLILAVAFPLGFYVLVSTFVGNETIDVRAGIRVAQFLAPAFASFGVVMSTFSFLAIGLAESRVTGVLKRQNGTPLPRWAMLGGRMGAAVLLGLASTALVIGVGVLAYDVKIIGATLASVIVTLVVASLSFCALGLAVASVASTPQVAQALTNGIVIPIAFVSDIFTFGGPGAPVWLSNIGWFFPLKHLVNALGDAFNPFLTGNGFAWDHLAVIAVWGIAGAAAAAWLLRPSREGSTSNGPNRARARKADSSPRRSASPTVWQLLRDQAAYTFTNLRRDFSAVFFSAAFPILLVIIIPAMNGGGDALLEDGTQLAAYFAATMAAYGAAVTSFVSMPEGVAEARAQGILKRAHGTPLPRWTMLLGRILGALVVSLITLIGCYLAVNLIYGTAIPQAWWSAVLVIVVAAVCFASIGLAVVSLVRSAQSVIGFTLGTLLPLSFISDIFVIGAPFPPVINAVSWFFPLRHATRAMTDVAATPAGVSPGLSLDHLGAMLAWTVVALLVVAWRFNWEGAEPRKKAPARAAKGARAAASS